MLLRRPFVCILHSNLAVPDKKRTSRTIIFLVGSPINSDFIILMCTTQTCPSTTLSGRKLSHVARSSLPVSPAVVRCSVAARHLYPFFVVSGPFLVLEVADAHTVHHCHCLSRCKREAYASEQTRNKQIPQGKWYPLIEGTNSVNVSQDLKTGLSRIPGEFRVENSFGTQIERR